MKTDIGIGRHKDAISRNMVVRKIFFVRSRETINRRKISLLSTCMVATSLITVGHAEPVVALVRGPDINQATGSRSICSRLPSATPLNSAPVKAPCRPLDVGSKANGLPLKQAAGSQSANVVGSSGLLMDHFADSPDQNEDGKTFSDLELCLQKEVALGDSELPNSSDCVVESLAANLASGPEAVTSGALGVQETGVLSASVGISAAAGYNSVALGPNADAAGAFSIAVGSDAAALATESVALGFAAAVDANESFSVAIGSQAVTSGRDSVSIGPLAGAAGYSPAATPSIGTATTFVGASTGANSRGNFNTALGSGAGVDVAGNGNTAVGFNAGNSVKDFIEGNNNSAFGRESGSDVFGSQNSAFGHNSGVDISGNQNTAAGYFSGRDVTGNQNVALGYSAGGNVLGSSNVAIGHGAGKFVTGSNNLSVGYGANTRSSLGISANDVVALGTEASATSDGAISLGLSASANGVGAMSLGARTVATKPGGVALGERSIASTAGGVAGFVPTQATSSQAQAIAATQSGALGAVSIGTGSAGGNRQIINVAAGSNDSDAVNVAQLKAVQSVAAAGWTLAGSNTATASIGSSGVVQFAGDGNILAIQTGTDDAGAIDIALNPNLELGLFGSIEIGAALLNRSGLAIAGGPSIKAEGISAGNAPIKGVANGVADTDAVNVAQLNAAAMAAGVGWDLSAEGANLTNVRNGSASGKRVDFSSGDKNIIVTKKLDSNDLVFDLADQIIADALILGDTTVTANGITVGSSISGGVKLRASGLGNGGNRITDVAPGLNPTDAVNVSQLASAMQGTTTTFVGNSGGTIIRAPGEALSVKGAASNPGSYSGKNIRTVTSPSDGAINIELAESPQFGSVTINSSGSGKISGVTAAALTGDSMEAVNGGQIVAFGNAVARAIAPDARYNAQTNSFDVNLVVGNKVFSDVQSALADQSGSLSSGWRVATEATGTGISAGDSSAFVAANSTMYLVAGDNLSVRQAGARVEYAVNPNLTKLESVSVINGPELSSRGIEMNGGRITNLSDGVAPSDAVTMSQLDTGLNGVRYQSKAYTDSVASKLVFDLRDYRRDSNGGIAAAMAMSTVPRVNEAGTGMLAMGVAHWQGQQAVAIGYSRASGDGRIVVQANGTYNSRKQAGASAGIGVQF